MAIESVPTTEKPKEASVEELREGFEKLQAWLVVILREKFGDLAGAEKAANGQDNRFYLDDMSEGGLRAEQKKQLNELLAKDYLLDLKMLQKLKEEFLDKNRTTIQIGITGIYRKLEDELKKIEQLIKSRTAYFRISGFHDVRDKINL